LEGADFGMLLFRKVFDPEMRDSIYKTWTNVEWSLAATDNLLKSYARASSDDFGTNVWLVFGTDHLVVDRFRLLRRLGLKKTGEWSDASANPVLVARNPYKHLRMVRVWLRRRDLPRVLVDPQVIAIHPIDWYEQHFVGI
jgi:hypothetical protein